MSVVAVDQALFSAAVKSMPEDRLSTTRQNAAQDFAATGFPTQRVEDWKYTSLAPAAKLSNEWLREFSAQPANETNWPEIDEIIAAVDAHWLVIRNGVADPDTLQSIASTLGSTISLEALSSGTAAHKITTDDPLSAFNAALLRDGLQITVHSGARTDKPLGILHADDSQPGHRNERLSQTRLIIDCLPDSSLQIVEYAMSRGEHQFSNSVVQVNLQENAKLDVVRLQNRQSENVGITRLESTLHTNAKLNHCAFDFGNGLGRNDILVDMAGTGAQANLSGLYLTNGKQHIDNHLCARHSIGPATSSQNYRGILCGQSRAVFNGKAEVLAGADGTDASQSNHNLLLSERCEVDTKPELEIYADDVKCSHGATIGQLDEAALFYLQTRGINRRDATQMLTRSFAATIINDVTIDASKDLVTNSLLQRLNQLLEGEAR